MEVAWPVLVNSQTMTSSWLSTLGPRARRHALTLGSRARKSASTKIVISSLLVACGGGGDSESSSTANATGDAGGAKDDSLTIKLTQGQLQGDMAGASRQFLKIPYAAPPAGPLRWKAPQAAPSWQGVRHETAFAEACPQNKSSQGGESFNEDCLYLNVWSPVGLKSKAPVMVWIHGGGNFAGSAGDKVPALGVAPAAQPLWYDGQFLASRHGVVVVSMNYRLGPMGFMSHAALGAEGSPLGNQGLLDQQMALTWVRDNIEKFGGDVGNVTIFGESAGSSDVCFHVVSPKSRGLFQRAISESGGCTISIAVGANATAESSAPGMQKFAEAVGCGDQSDVLACMRAKTVEELMAHAEQPNPAGGSSGPPPYVFGAVVDGPGGFVPEEPRKLFATGNVAKVPYLLGSNQDEGTLFTLALTAPTDDASYRAYMKSQFGAAGDAAATLYDPNKYGGYGAAIARAWGDSGLVCGTHDTARRAAAAGLPVFMYNFDVSWAAVQFLLGAAHSSEISHVFGNPFNPTAADTSTSNAMGDYWTRFARTGDPNGAGAPAVWPAFEPSADDSDQRLQIDTGFSAVTDFRKEECAFWRTVYDAAEGG